MDQILKLLGSWEVLSPVIIATSAWIIIGLEHLFPYDKGQKLFRKGWFTDFFWYTLVQSYLLIGFFFVTHDFYIYWFHRAQHKFPILWRLHEAHHSVRDVDWLAGSRSHAFEIMINQTIEFMPIVLLGAPPEMALIKGTIDAVWGMYIHSNINVRTGLLQRVINGPEMHRWHHSREYIGDGMNYGTKLAIWDWIFGTAHLPKEKPPGYGLSEEFPDGYFQQTAYAFRKFEQPETASTNAS